MQPYRSDLEALEARHAALEAEVADRVRQRDDAARMLAEARARERDAEIAADHASGGPARRKAFVVSVALGAVAFAAMVGAVSRITSRPNDREVRMARVMVQFEKFTNEACACTSSECVTALSDRMASWANEVAKDVGPNEKPDERTMQRAQALGQRMGECMTKAMSAPAIGNAYETQESGISGRSNSNDSFERAE